MCAFIRLSSKIQCLHCALSLNVEVFPNIPGGGGGGGGESVTCVCVCVCVCAELGTLGIFVIFQ